MNKCSDIAEITKTFQIANVQPYRDRVPVWQLLQYHFRKRKVNHSTFKNDNNVLVQGKDVTSAILSEAIEYFCRAFYNFYAHDKLIENSYATWSGVTNYYSSFFSLHSLLRLQARAITSIWRDRIFYVFPYDLEKHQYVISRRGVNRKTSHGAAWFLFYEVYDSFRYDSNPLFEHIFKKKHTGTVEEEIDFRTQVNYEPYRGYDEIRESVLPSIIEEYENKRFVNEEIKTLSSLTTDPLYKYYARSVLRIIFAYYLLKQVAEVNADLKGLISNRKTSLSDFVKKANVRKEKEAVCCKLIDLLEMKV
jgi:hypothetical protein